jgi:hypothetical protein
MMAWGRLQWLRTLDSHVRGEDQDHTPETEQDSGGSPLAHHVAQGHAGKVHRLRPCADAKSAIETAVKDYKISERLTDRLIATPEEE